MLAHPQQLEYCSNGQLWTDWEWVRPFYLWMSWKFLKFPLPVTDSRVKGEEELKKDRGCRYKVVSSSLETWDSWLYYFLLEVREKLRPRNPKVCLRVQQQILLRLLTFRTSILFSFFFQLCQAIFGTLRFGSIQLDIVLVCLKIAESSFFYFFLQWIQKLNSLSLHTLTCW